MIAFNEILSLNWDVDFHKIGKPVPKQPFMFGMVIFDWDETFRKRLRKYTNLNDITIPFQYIEQIPTWSKAANYSDVSDIIGRFEPYNVYSGSAAQDFSLNLIYYAEALKAESGVTTPWTLEYIEILIKRIQSLVFPAYDGQFTPPPKLLLNIGNHYRDIPFIIKNVAIDSLEPFHIKTGLTMHRKITLECRVSYPMWQSFSSFEIWSAYDGNAGANGPDVYAVETLNEKYRPKSKRSANANSVNTPF